MIRYKDTNLSDEDIEFLGYCETHSESERALFSREHIGKLYDLMNEKHSKNLLDFHSIDQYRMREIIDIIKVRQSKELWIFPEETVLQLERQAR